MLYSSKPFFESDFQFDLSFPPPRIPFGFEPIVLELSFFGGSSDNLQYSCSLIEHWVGKTVGQFFWRAVGRTAKELQPLVDWIGDDSIIAGDRVRGEFENLDQQAIGQ